MLLYSLEFREGEKRLIKIATEKFLDFSRGFELRRSNLRQFSPLTLIEIVGHPKGKEIDSFSSFLAPLDDLFQ